MARATGKDHAPINLDPGHETWLQIINASDPSSWRRLSRPGWWFVYTMHESQRRISVPLYVGMTGDLYRRLSIHRRDRVWWPLVGDIVLERFASKQDAAEAEELRIHKLRPLFNITGNVHATPAKDH